MLVLAQAALPGWLEARPAVVVSADVPVFGEALDGARAALGDPIIYDLSTAGPEAVEARLSRERPDAVVAIGPGALRVVTRARLFGPIVYLLVADPEAILGRAGQRPIAGIALSVSPEVVLDVLRRLVPAARVLWTVYSRAEAGVLVERWREAAGGRGYAFSAAEAGDPGDAVRRLLAPPARVDAYVMLPDRVVRNAAADQVLRRVSFERRFAVVGLSVDDVRAGALFALQLDARALGGQAGAVARRALSANVPRPAGTIAPTGYRLVLNVATARQLGIAVPLAVRGAATQLLGE